MKQFKGTPGPWFVEENEYVCTSDGTCVAAFGGIFISEKDIQNANLCSAAPELLEVVLDLKFKLYGNAPANPKTEAVIAKALGEQS